MSDLGDIDSALIASLRGTYQTLVAGGMTPMEASGAIIDRIPVVLWALREGSI